MTDIILIIGLIVISALSAATEIAYTSVNTMRLEALAEDGKKFGARRAYGLKKKFSSALSTLLIGNNLVNIEISSLSTIIAIRLFGGSEGIGALVATFAATVIILIFGEITPKTIAKQHSLTVTRYASYPLTVLIILFKPITAPFMFIVNLISKIWVRNGDVEGKVTEDELESIIDTVEEEGVIDEDRSELLKSAFDFSDITVEEILTHRKKLTVVDISDSYEKNAEIILNSSYSRIPVYRDSIDEILGVINVKKFLKAYASGEMPAIEDCVSEPCYMHKTTKLPAALDDMKSEQIHIAIILDEYGGTMGIVTMEDILEEIVGDIWDEDEEIISEWQETADNTYDVAGDANINDFFDFIGFDDRNFESEYLTLGGWAVEMLEEDPHEGESFEYKNLYVIVTELEDNIVNRLSVVVKEAEETE